MDSTIDRIGELIIWSVICINYVNTDIQLFTVVSIITASGLIPYLRAKGESYRAKTIDGHFLDFIQTDRLSDLVDAHNNGLIEACGFGPIMSFLKLDIKPKVLDYRNSGDTAGSKDSVVGYTSIGAFWND